MTESWEPPRIRSLAALQACCMDAARWFASSASHVNPAATCGDLCRGGSAGIAPAGVHGFIAAQLVGAGLGWGLDGWLAPPAPSAH